MIKEAWGKNYPPSGTDKNGWLSEIHLTNAQCCELNKDESLEYNNVFGYRPKSLEGIENNNGWIRIESEDDLPKENGLYHVMCFGVETILEYFDNSKIKGFIIIGNTFINKYNDIGITHYQPIVKPKKPIY